MNSGTGVAPMRALMHERIYLATTSSVASIASALEDATHVTNKGVGSTTVLLFGCRSQQDDYLYEQEWPQCVAQVHGNGQVVINCTSDDAEEVLRPFNFSTVTLPEEEDITGARAVAAARKPTAVVVTAFSRRGRNAGRRVTHSLQTHQEAIWSLIQRVLSLSCLHTCQI